MRFRPLHILIALSAAACLLSACRHGGDGGRQHRNLQPGGAAASVNWRDSAEKRYDRLVYYYNENLHDSLVMLARADLEFLSDKEQWNRYYDTWMLLAEDYTFNGEFTNAIREAQLIHADARQRNSRHGLTVAEYIKGLVYDGQQNHQESARSLHEALRQCPDLPTLKNNIYAYYMTELKLLNDTLQMRHTIDEWAQYIDHCKAERNDGRRLISWLYLFHRSCYGYYSQRKDYYMAAAAVDSVQHYIDMAGSSLVSANEILGYRMELAIARHDYGHALQLADQQLPLAQKLDINALMELLNNRRLAYAGIGRWQEAYNDLMQVHETQDSLNVEETRQQLNELNKRFEVDALKAQQERETMQHERTRLYLLVAIGTFVLVALVVFIFFRHRAALRLRAAHQQLQSAYDLLEETTTAKERIESELRIARDIQMSMVPGVFPSRDGLDLYASMAPAREVGGDLYDYFLQDDQLYFCVGDVSGKGVPASLFMAQTIRLFRALAKQHNPPAMIATRINAELTENNEQGMFVTMFIGLLDLQTGCLDFCNCGHNPPVIGGDASHGSFLQMEANAPLGLWPDLQYVGERIDSIKDRPLFVYTDGLNEAEDQRQQQFGNDRLLTVLRHTRYASARQVIDSMQHEVDAHRAGAPLNDDLTMMCLKIA